MTNKTQRDAFWDGIYELALDDKDIYVVSADMGAPALDKFRKDLTNQYIDVGIAEQQAVGVAVGMALEGKKVYAYAIAPFITLRCYEHIRVSMASMNVPVTLVGVGAGFSYDDSGPTHHMVEDFNTLRALPHMTVHSVTDAPMASALASITRHMTGPDYVRLDRKPLPDIYKPDDDFTAGLKVLVPSETIAIVATGNMVHTALEASDVLRNKGIQAGVIDVYRLPIEPAGLLEALSGVACVITLEEHALPGGFGSAVCEVLADAGRQARIKRMGCDFSEGYCYAYGGRAHLQKLMGIDTEAVVAAAQGLL
ncbi:MAG: transketolase C-terminal domain-containing protein [Myxococcota bacterium]|nr:transketolase C-terminal domain-containing protein [Myxococcota bacterium]